MTNKLVIFRVPSHIEEGIQLVEIGFTDGVLSDEGEYFTVAEDDTYNNLSYGQIVIADKTENGSVNARFISVKSQATDEKVEIYKLGYEELNYVVQYLIGEISKTPEQ